MKFSLLVLSPPQAQAGDSAWQFARAALLAGHEIYRVFFYQDGTYHGNAMAQPAQDEVDRVARWAELSQQSNVDLVLCIASALKRGVLDAGEASRHGCSASNAHPAFELSGLGQLIDARLNSDRLLTFGS
ncbi:MAG: sulfurtransferase complex subunit TusD [Halieaceae bacterium]